MSDRLTEMLVGQSGAIRMPAKLVLRPGPTEDIGRQIGMWGAAICPPELCPIIHPDSEGLLEMWECEIIILPRRKYTGKLSMEKNGVEGSAFGGMRADQILCGEYYNPDYWGLCYWKVPGGR